MAARRIIKLLTRGSKLERFSFSQQNQQLQRINDQWPSSRPLHLGNGVSFRAPGYSEVQCRLPVGSLWVFRMRTYPGGEYRCLLLVPCISPPDCSPWTVSATCNGPASACPMLYVLSHFLVLGLPRRSINVCATKFQRPWPNGVVVFSPGIWQYLLGVGLLLPINGRSFADQLALTVCIDGGSFIIV